ncbi:MAG: hypothetical protein V7707_20555 [Motiliproteus sp.]
MPNRSTRCNAPGGYLWLASLLALSTVTGSVLAEEVIGLPYTTVAPGLPGTQLGIGYIQTEADADSLAEPQMIEIPADGYSTSYRNGIDVYKEITDQGFDNEPMVVIYPEADPSLVTDIVVIAASSESVYTHVTPAQSVVDPVAQGEDDIYLQISAPPDPLEGERVKVIKPKERRFFSPPVE